MKQFHFLPVLAGALLISACTTAETLEGEPVPTAPAAASDAIPPPPAAGLLGSELYAQGATVRVELSGGEVNTITFRPDGTFRALIHSTNQAAEGNWWVANNQMCLRPRSVARAECWPYPNALQPGQTVTLTSDRGNNARITLISAPATALGPCGTYGMMDRDNDGLIEVHEWNAYRTGGYGSWDVNRDGKVDRTEFTNCWKAGGFYPPAAYSPDYESRYWSAFDTNNDGWLSADEYWGAAAWSRLDRNRNGILDQDEWRW